MHSFTHYRPDGKTTVKTKAPDTITSWVASAFAMHPSKGLGISNTTATVTTICLLEKCVIFVLSVTVQPTGHHYMYVLVNGSFF